MTQRARDSGTRRRKITCVSGSPGSSGAAGLAAGSPLFPPYLLPFLSKLRTIHKRGGYCQVREQFPITRRFVSFQGKRREKQRV